jgi:integrase
MTQRRQFGRVRRLASGRWQARYPDGGGGDVSAPHTFATKGDAQRFLTSIEADMLKGAYIDPRGGRTTLAAWSREWLDGDRAKRATTRARDETVLRTHFLPTLGRRPLGAITPLDVRRAVEAMSERLAPATVRTNLGVLAAALNAAVEADLLGRSPVRGIKLVSVRPDAKGTLTPEQLMRLAEEVPGRYRALILLGGMVGLRWSEAIGLRVGRVHFLSRTLEVSETIAEVEGRLSVEATKTESSVRTLSIPEPLIEELARHLATYCPGAGPDELVFTGPKGMPLRRSFAARVFKPAVTRAGLDPTLTFRGLRKVATSFMVDDGVHPRVIQYRLGHATARLSQELYAKGLRRRRSRRREPSRSTVFVRYGHAAGTKAGRRLSRCSQVEVKMASDLGFCEWR